MRQPVEVFPPGEFIAEEVAERGWKSEYVCKRLGISADEYAELLAGSMRVDGRLSTLLGGLFGVDQTFFVRLEMAWRHRR